MVQLVLSTASHDESSAAPTHRLTYKNAYLGGPQETAVAFVKFFVNP